MRICIPLTHFSYLNNLTKATEIGCESNDGINKLHSRDISISIESHGIVNGPIVQKWQLHSTIFCPIFTTFRPIMAAESGWVWLRELVMGL